MKKLFMYFIGAILISGVLSCSDDTNINGERLSPLSITAPIHPMGQCIKNCKEWQRYAIGIETERYKQAIENCNGDIRCLEMIAQEHNSLLIEIDLDTQSCIYFCKHGPSGH